MSGSIALGGTPTEPDVEKLVKAYPVSALSVGREILHEELLEVLNTEGDFVNKHGEPVLRYKTVVSRWRNRMEELYNIRLGAIRGTGLRVLEPIERLSEAERHAKSAFRQARKSHKRASAIEPTCLDTEAQRRQIHAIQMSAMILGHKRVLSSPIPGAPRPS